MNYFQVYLPSYFFFNTMNIPIWFATAADVITITAVIIFRHLLLLLLLLLKKIVMMRVDYIWNRVEAVLSVLVLLWLEAIEALIGRWQKSRQSDRMRCEWKWRWWRRWIACGRERRRRRHAIQFVHVVAAGKWRRWHTVRKTSIWIE